MRSDLEKIVEASRNVYDDIPRRWWVVALWENSDKILGSQANNFLIISQLIDSLDNNWQ